MAVGDTVKHGLALRFHVVIDAVDLGGWAKCDGLTVEFKPRTYEELGNTVYVPRFPGPATYTNIRLSRACTSAESAALQGFLSAMRTKPTKGTASIGLLDAWGALVLEWTLMGVFPIKWTGPTLDAKQTEVAYEELELAHDGFLD